MQQITKDTTQYIKNKSYDPTFDVSTLELLGHDSENNVLRRIQVDDTGAVKVSGLSRVLSVLVTDPNGDALTTGDGKAYVRIPSIMNGWNLVGVEGHVTTVSSSGLPSIAIYNVTQIADMLSTNLTIDANEKDSKDATTPAVIDTGNDDVATGDEIRVDCDGAGTGTKGLIIDLIFALP